MSRSYRKIGVWKDHDRAGSAKSWKKIANRKLRRNAKKYRIDESGRSGYKKATRMQWEIHDYKWTTTESEARKFYRTHVGTYYWLDQFEDEEDYINNYWKRSIRK